MGRGAEVVVLDRPHAYSSLRRTLVPANNATALRKFDLLNRHLDGRGSLNPGEVIVLGDPDAPECTREEIELMRESERVHDILRPLDVREAESWRWMRATRRWRCTRRARWGASMNVVK